MTLTWIAPLIIGVILEGIYDRRNGIQRKLFDANFFLRMSMYMCFYLVGMLFR